MAPCSCTFDSVDSSDKDQLDLPMEPNSEDPKDDNDQEAEVAPCCMTGLLVTSKRLQSMLPRFIVDCPLVLF